ncbi:lipoprotein [Spiroplasma endosymbiont of Stenodema calcarata]|uniref:lipoprotein n=1 Tax=Spiroplasma endosymbiont of Stenodema calcarata TaxID=3139328 RepID=UPI003CCACDC5
MKKFLVLLTSISLGTIVSTNVVACFPPKKDNGNDINGYKLNLDLFAFDKISDKFNLKKDNVIVENKIDLKSGIIKGIQNIISIYLPWNEVDITIDTIKPELTTFKQVYVKMVAKDDAKSIKGSVMWGNLEAAAPTYVDLRPNLKAWLSEEQKTLKVDDANKLDVAAFEALGGPALGKSNLTELGLKGVYDPDTNSYTVSADGTKSDFFATSDLVFKAVINK